MNPLRPDTRCAVLVAHPGHELVIHGFMEQAKPVVAILTDGSGKSGVSRVASTDRVLEGLGASQAGFYGRYTDRDCYAAMLRHDMRFFTEIADELALLLADEAIDTVVGDASEGWNPVHDVWRSAIDAAVAVTSIRTGRTIANYEFLLFSSHVAAERSEEAVVVALDEDAYGRKIASGALYTELHDEVKAAMSGTTAHLVPSPELSAMLDQRLRGLNAESYRTELLRPAPPEGRRDFGGPRVYELYAQMLVAQGRYREAIRYEEHVLPIEAALREHILRADGAASVAHSPR